VLNETKLEDPMEERVRVFFGDDHTAEEHNARQTDCSEEQRTLKVKISKKSLIIWRKKIFDLNAD
jgi:hypothetical protein